MTTYDYQRDEYPILAPSKYGADDYRVGFDARLWKFDLSFMQGWRFFKDDTRYLTDKFQIGNNPTNTSVLNSYERDLPSRDPMLGWRPTPSQRATMKYFLVVAALRQQDQVGPLHRARHDAPPGLHGRPRRDLAGDGSHSHIEYVPRE